MFPHITPTKRGVLINPVADGSWPRTRVSVEQYNYRLYIHITKYICSYIM